MGRPLGKPDDPEFQRGVLDAAFALLDAPEGPVLVDFPVEIRDEADTPLACNLPPRSDESLPEAVDETKGLRPAYDRAVAKHGRTNVGRVAGPDGVPDLVASFVKILEGTPYKEAGIPTNNLLEASKDIMSYYEEAAVALSDHVPGARSAESWFFRETASGKLLKDVRDKLTQDGLKVAFYITPATQ